MLGFIILGILFVAIAWYVFKDMNTPLAQKITTAVKSVESKTKSAIIETVDLNNDNKVSVEDVKVAVKKVKKTAAKTAAKVKRPRTKKPKE